MRVGLVFGGRSVEHKVSVDSARAVGRALAEAGHEVLPLGIASDGCWVAPDRAARALAGEIDALPAVGDPLLGSLAHLIAARPQVVFPVAHGTFGEDGTLQGLCEMLDLPYAGAGVAASAVAMDKLLAKRQLAAAGVPVVDFEPVTRRQLDARPGAVRERLARLAPPLFVKPSNGGSSVGVRRVEAAGEVEAALSFALRFDDTALVERAIVGRELECSVLGDAEPEASAVGEVIPGASFYDYADKYLDDAARLELPAELEPEVERRVRELACRAFLAIGCSGMARVDFLLESATSEVFVNELNTLPGFTRISMYPKLWELSGVPLPELVDRLLAIGVERHARRRALDGEIRAWLAELG